MDGTYYPRHGDGQQGVVGGPLLELYSLTHQASLMQMQATNYQLPIQSYSHQEILPVGFVASHQTGKPLVLD